MGSMVTSSNLGQLQLLDDYFTVLFTQATRGSAHKTTSGRVALEAERLESFLTKIYVISVQYTDSIVPLYTTSLV